MENVAVDVMLPAVPAPVPSPGDAVPAVHGESPEGLAERWIQFLDVSEKTRETYERAIRSWLRWLRDRRIFSPSRADVLAYRTWLQAELAPASVNLYMAALRIFSAWLEEEGLNADVARRVKGMKLDRSHRKDYLTSGQASRLLEGVDRSTLQGLRDYAALALMATTGLRTVSVVSANIGDLGTAGDAAVLRYRSKGRLGKGEFVKLARPVEDAVRAYLAARSAGGALTPDEPLFASGSRRNRGGRLTTRSLSRMVKQRLAAAGFSSPRLTAHSLRHTAATLNLLGGGTVEETRQLLGHSSVSTTMIYTHELDRAASKSEGRIAGMIFGAEPEADGEAGGGAAGGEQSGSGSGAGGGSGL